jgi:hypothetical protein
MEGNTRGYSTKVLILVGQRLLRTCLKCGTGAGLGESMVPAIVLQKWICLSCGTLNQFEIEFRSAIN